MAIVAHQLGIYNASSNPFSEEQRNILNISKETVPGLETRMHADAVLYKFPVSEEDAKKANPVFEDAVRSLSELSPDVFRMVYTTYSDGENEGYSMFKYYKNGVETNRFGEPILASVWVRPDTGGVFQQDNGKLGIYYENPRGVLTCAYVEPGNEGYSCPFTSDKVFNDGAKFVSFTDKTGGRASVAGRESFRVTYNDIIDGVARLAKDMALYEKGDERCKLCEADAKRVLRARDLYKENIVNVVSSEKYPAMESYVEKSGGSSRRMGYDVSIDNSDEGHDEFN